jgi:hypothetical protein
VRQWPLGELALYLALLTTAWFGLGGPVGGPKVEGKPGQLGQRAVYGAARR